MKRGQFTFYRSFWEAVKELPAKEKTAVICAVCAYALDGEEPSLTGTAKAIFTLMRPVLDNSAKKAENGKQRNKEKANEKQTESKTEANEKQTVKEKEKEKEIEIEIENEYEIEKEGENDSSLPHKAPSRVEKEKYGQFGWVRLSKEEYDRLLQELGEAELNRCIAYVDESAQKSGNKNRWKDWNLVIRNCHRDGWGMKNYNTKPSRIYGGTQKGGPTEEEYQRMQRMLAQMGGESDV